MSELLIMLGRVALQLDPRRESAGRGSADFAVIPSNNPFQGHLNGSGLHTM
jgi:hypothetical protein